MRTLLRPIQAGFTLVELLIVVIILAVLAAIIVPQFSSATIDAKESALDANLARLRSSIELFQAQHGGIYPASVGTGGGSCPTGATAGNAAANTAQALLDHMLMYSNAAGQTCSIGDATFKYGPYVRKGFPNDSITGSSDIAVRSPPTGAPFAPSAATGGWAYDSKSGEIVMNSNANDTRTKPYYTH